MTIAFLVKCVFLYGIPVICMIMFMRELLVSYFIRPKFEDSVTSVLKTLTIKIDKIENILDHNVNRIETDIPKSSEISKVVASVRAKLNASRAYVLRFHDGSAFSTNAPVWKISLTHESTDSSIVSIAEKTKDVFIANIIQLVSTVFGEKDSDSGITVLKGTDEHSSSNVFRIDSEAVEATPLKGFLLSRGIRHLLYSPVFNVNGKPIALFCIDYSGSVPEFLTDEYAVKEMTENASILTSLMS